MSARIADRPARRAPRVRSDATRHSPGSARPRRRCRAAATSAPLRCWSTLPRPRAYRAGVDRAPGGQRAPRRCADPSGASRGGSAPVARPAAPPAVSRRAAPGPRVPHPRADGADEQRRSGPARRRRRCRARALVDCTRRDRQQPGEPALAAGGAGEQRRADRRRRRRAARRRRSGERSARSGPARRRRRAGRSASAASSGRWRTCVRWAAAARGESAGRQRWPTSTASSRDRRPRRQRRRASASADGGGRRRAAPARRAAASAAGHEQPPRRRALVERRRRSPPVRPSSPARSSAPGATLRPGLRCGRRGGRRGARRRRVLGLGRRDGVVGDVDVDVARCGGSARSAPSRRPGTRPPARRAPPAW